MEPPPTKLGIIDIRKVLLIRASKKKWLRALWAGLFIFWIYFFWCVLHIGQSLSPVLLWEAHPTRSILTFTLLIIPGIYSVLGEGRLPNVFLLIATSVSSFILTFGLTIYLILVPMAWIEVPEDGAEMAGMLAFGVALLILCWRFLFRYWLLFLKLVVPFKKWKKYKLYHHWLLEAESKRKKAKSKNRLTKPSTPKSIYHRRLFFISSGPLIIFIHITWVIGILIVLSPTALQNLFEGNFHTLLDNMNKVLNSGTEQNSGGLTENMNNHMWKVFGALSIFGTPGYIGWWVFGFLWDRYRRSAIKRSQTPISRIMTSSDMLYLRQFDKEEQTFGDRIWNVKRLFFSAYERHYTYEELLAERLAFIGKLYGLGAKKNGKQKLEELTPPGAIRYYVDDWKEEVQKAMPIAQIIVVSMGETMDQDHSLGEEIHWIKKGGFLEKTLFIMPPEIRSRRMKRIWKQFTKEVFLSYFDYKDLCKIRETQILAVLFYQKMPIVVLGPRRKRRNTKSYQSALDIAGSFITESSNRKLQAIDTIIR